MVGWLDCVREKCVSGCVPKQKSKNSSVPAQVYHTTWFPSIVYEIFYGAMLVQEGGFIGTRTTMGYDDETSQIPA